MTRDAKHVTRLNRAESEVTGPALAAAAVRAEQGAQYVRTKCLLKALAITIVVGLRSQAFAQTVMMDGTIAPEATTATSVGVLDPQRVLTLDICFAPRNQDQLNQLLAGQIDPHSPNYHKWITSEEYLRRFGPTDADFDMVKHWLTKSGFHIAGGTRAEGFIRFSGAVATVENAFKTEIDDFGDEKFANVTEPSLPPELAGKVADILGMQNLGRLERAYKMSPRMAHAASAAAIQQSKRSKHNFGAQFYAGSSLGYTFAAPDFYVNYDETPLLNDGITGNNGSDCIGIFARTDVYAEPQPGYSSCAEQENSSSFDCIIADYFNFFSQYTSESTVPSLSADFSGETNPGIVAGPDGEAYLDIEWAHVVAPGAPLVLYVTNPGNFSLTTYEQELSGGLAAMVSENRCGALNFSYKTCGNPKNFFTSTLTNLFNQAQSQGQSVFVAAGDNGADTCGKGVRNINELSANPLTTSVGGTGFDAGYGSDGFTTGYNSPEFAWNDSDPNDSSTWGQNVTTGGGASAVYAKPAWQLGLAGATNDNHRDVPDVAMIADPDNPGVLITEDTDNNGSAANTESVVIIGGTSLASPVWAGISRLLQQANGGERLGSLNPRIYQMGLAGQAANGFHDLTEGNNNYISLIKNKPVTVDGYFAGPGYDLVTGWGTVDIADFVASYLAPPSPVASILLVPTEVNFGAGLVGGDTKVKKLIVENSAKRGGQPITLENFLATANVKEAPGSTCAIGTILEATQKCDLMLVFALAQTGSNSGEVQIVDNAGNGPQQNIACVANGKP
jgi:subtilase family serine protease